MQINKTINLLAFLIAIFLIACKPTILNEEKYIKYINESDNGFLQEKKIGDVEIKLLQKPSCLVAGTDTSNHYEHNLYFNLSYSAIPEQIVTVLLVIGAFATAKLVMIIESHPMLFFRVSL